jgi:hypothetical protein
MEPEILHQAQADPGQRFGQRRPYPGQHGDRLTTGVAYRYDGRRDARCHDADRA